MERGAGETGQPGWTGGCQRIENGPAMLFDSFASGISLSVSIQSVLRHSTQQVSLVIGESVYTPELSPAASGPCSAEKFRGRPAAGA